MATLNIKGFPEELYQHLGELAKKDRRSLTGEVIYLLEWAALETSTKDKSSILQLKGLGKKRWKGTHVSKHIATERDAWE